MTAVAAEPHAAHQPKASRAPKASPAAPGRMAPVASMRRATAQAMLKLAGDVAVHPKVSAGDHVRDAVRTLQAGDEEAAQRHLRAAMDALTPQSLMRLGIHDDKHHIAARRAMEGVGRHLLLVKDVAGARAANEARNLALISRQAAEDATGSRPAPSYGGDPGALAQKPTARQPGGDRALNAPARTNAGRVDPNVAMPRGRQPRGSRQFATWDEAGRAVEMAVSAELPVYGWEDLATVVEMSVSPAETGRMDARTPATAGTVRGHGRPDGSRPTCPSVDIPITRTDTGRSRRPGDRQGITLASTAVAGPLTGQPSTGGKGKARTTSSPSASRAITSTTEAARGLLPGSAMAQPNSPTSRYSTSTAAGVRDQRPSPGSTGYLSRQSITSSTAGHGLTSLGLSAPTSRPGASGANVTRTPGSATDKSWPSTPAGARARQRLAASSAYPRRLSGRSSTAGRGFTSLDLSAQTARLAATPAPYGRPGGPGLYDVKGLKHGDYFENIVQALMRKRGMSKGQASAVAWVALRRWSTGRNTTRKGHVTPVVRAAAGRALGQEAMAAARAKAAHAHSVTWDDIGGAVELAASGVSVTKPVIGFGSRSGGGYVFGGDGVSWEDVASVVELAVVDVKTYQRTVMTPRGPVVQTVVQHPQNYKQGAGTPASVPRTRAPAKQAPEHRPPPSRAARKQRLLATAAGDRRHAALLSVTLAVFSNVLWSKLPNTTAAQKGATTAAQAGATTAATAGTIPTTSAAATTAANAGIAPAAVTTAQARAQAAAVRLSVPQLQNAIRSFQVQIAGLNQQAAGLTARAAKL